MEGETTLPHVGELLVSGHGLVDHGNEMIFGDVLTVTELITELRFCALLS